MKTIHERIAAGEYINLFPISPHAVWRAEERRLNQKFEHDLLAEHGVEEVKAKRLYDFAWEHGHAGGLSEVANYFAELVELIRCPAR